MSLIPARPKLAPCALALAALALPVTASATDAAGRSGTAPASTHPKEQRLVVRGDATAVDGPCDARGCRLELTDGRFRGTPVGTGAYTGSITLKVADAFPNGEGGICAPLIGRIVMGAGTADRLTLAVSGDSCQDGAGPLDSAAFTGLARFTVKRGTGVYSRATGAGLASLSEDAANHHRITLIGRITH
jgi:hypothetical protein